MRENKADSRFLSAKIKNLRKYLNLTLASFGTALGYSGSQVQQFEQNKTEPLESLIKRICEIYDVDPGYFEGEVDLQDAVSKERVFDKEKNEPPRCKQLGIRSWFLFFERCKQRGIRPMRE